MDVTSLPTCRRAKKRTRLPETKKAHEQTVYPI